jgi:hypothetical protein
MRGGVAITAMLTFAGAMLAQQTIPQAGVNPILIDQTSATDNVQVLLATWAERTSDLAVQYPNEGRKNFWIYNFLTAADYVAWTVSVPAAAPYQVTTLLSAANGQQISLTVNGGTPVQFTANGNWDRLTGGIVTLPAGIVRLVLRRTGDLSGDVKLKSLELLRASDVDAYNARVAAARANTAWFSHAKYGLMFQYGAWGFPDNAGPAKSLNQQAADFDVPLFVDRVVATGASYVIWSISWWGYHMDAPLTSPNSIVTAAGGPANPGLTATTDLIGNVAAALHRKGIRFLLYYHAGTEDEAWWPYQRFPKEFSSTGTGDRSIFLRNWVTVVSEMGKRYGNDLDAFMFDDGMIYYPAPFEKLERIARTGNPRRLISWNSWVMPRFTDFQDIYFGEANHGEAMAGSAPVGGNGVFISGPQRGLLQQGMFMMDGDWGVHTRGGGVIATNSSVTSSAAIGWVASAASRNVPVSFDLMMYEDGTMAPSDLAILNDVRQSVYGTIEALAAGATGVKDTDAAVTYRGSGWRHSVTATNGDSVNFIFSGTSVDVLGPKSKTGSRFTVSVDGSVIGSFSEFAETYTPQAVIYGARHLAAGTHTISLTKTDGTSFQIDGFRVMPSQKF